MHKSTFATEYERFGWCVNGGERIHNQIPRVFLDSIEK